MAAFMHRARTLTLAHSLPFNPPQGELYILDPSPHAQHYCSPTSNRARGDLHEDQDVPRPTLA